MRTENSLSLTRLNADEVSASCFHSLSGVRVAPDLLSELIL